MKRLLILFLIFIITQSTAFCDEQNYTTSTLNTYSHSKYYGLKDNSGKIVVNAKYKKLIRVGNNAWIIQKKNNKFGLIDCCGNILIEPKYTYVDRIFDNMVKFGNNNKFGLYNDKGEVIIPAEFSSIEPLFGKRFLTCKNYKYGIYNSEGKLLLDNEYEFIYAPTPKTLRIKYMGNWYEIESISEEEAITLPADVVKVKFDDKDFKVTQVFINTGVGTGYSVVTAADYLLKMVSTVSTAYEHTIDDLMLSQGAETVSIFIKLGWLPKFPFIYARNYYHNLLVPNSGPLSDVREDLKNKLK